jgi:hypothetical protein
MRDERRVFRAAMRLVRPTARKRHAARLTKLSVEVTPLVEVQCGQKRGLHPPVQLAL